MVDLQRRVRDAELAGEHRLEIVAEGVAVLVPVHEHVCRSGRHAGRDPPDVQVVDLDDMGARRHRGADRGRVNPRRGGFEEDPPRRPQQARARAASVQVGEDVRERALGVEGAPLTGRAPGPVEQPGGGEVDAHPGERNAEHQAAGHGLRRHEG